MSMATVPYVREMDRLRHVHGLGDQLNAFSDAAELFANNRAASIRDGQRVDRNRLVREGLLPDSFPEKTPFGQALEVRYGRDRYGNVTGVVYERGRTDPNSRYTRLNDMAMESLKRQAAQYGQEKSDNAGFSRQFGYIPARRSIFHGLFSDFTFRMNGLAGSEPSASVLIAPPRVLAYAEDNPNEVETGRAGKQVDETTKRAPHGAKANDQGTPATGFFRDSPSDSVGHDTPGKRDKGVKNDTGDRGIMVAGIGKEGAGTSNGYTPAGVPQAAGVYIPSDVPGMSMGGDMQTSRRAPFFWMGVMLVVGAVTLALSTILFMTFGGLGLLVALAALAIFLFMLLPAVIALTILTWVAFIVLSILAFVAFILLLLAIVGIDVLLVLAITAMAILLMLLSAILPFLIGLLWSLVVILTFCAAILIFTVLQALNLTLIMVVHAFVQPALDYAPAIFQAAGAAVPVLGNLLSPALGTTTIMVFDTLHIANPVEIIVNVMNGLSSMIGNMLAGLLFIVGGLPSLGIGGIIAILGLSLATTIGGILPGIFQSLADSFIFPLIGTAGGLIGLAGDLANSGIDIAGPLLTALLNFVLGFLPILTPLLGPILAIIGELGGLGSDAAVSFAEDMIGSIANIATTGLNNISKSLPKAVTALIWGIINALSYFVAMLLIFLPLAIIGAIIATWAAGLWGLLLQAIIDLVIFLLATLANLAISALMALVAVGAWALFNLINLALMAAMTLVVFIIQALFWLASFALATITWLLTSLLNFAGPMFLAPLILVIGSALFFTARTIFQVQMGAQIQSKAILRNIGGWLAIVAAALAFVGSLFAFDVAAGILSLLTGFMPIPFIWAIVPTILGLVFFVAPWALTNLGIIGAVSMSALRKFRSGIMLPRNILLSSLGLAGLGLFMVTAAYLMAYLTSVFTMMVPSFIIHTATLEVILAMGVTILIAMAVLAIGFVLSTVALGLAIAIIAAIFIVATLFLVLGILAALALGFLGTLIPPLIPILPIVLATILGALIYAAMRILYGFTEAGTQGVASAGVTALQALADLAPQ